MALDLATIGVGMETSGLEKGQAALNKTEQAANKAADAADRASGRFTGLSESSDKTRSASERLTQRINDQIGKLERQATTFGMSASQAQLYKMATDGATAAQIKQADAAMKSIEAQEKNVRALKDARDSGEAFGNAMKVGAVAIVAGVTATAYAFEKLIGNIANYQDLAEKTGADPAGLAALRTAADVGGTSVEALGAAANRLQTGLSKVDDESKGVGRALQAIGINVQDFKKLSPEVQLREIAKGLNQYADGGSKVAVVQAILGRGSAALLPAMKELGNEQEAVNRLTNEQIGIADDYKDAQARAHSEVMQMAEVLAVQALPAITEMTGAFKDSIVEVLGLGKGAADLQQGQAIQSWAKDAGVALSYLVDIGQIVIGVLRAIGKVAGAQLAVTGEVFGTILAAYEQVKSGNFSGAWDALKSGAAGVKSVVGSVKEDLAGLMDEKLLGSTFRDNMAKNAVAVKGVGDAADKTKPSLNGFTAAQEKSGDASKALTRELKEQDKVIAELAGLSGSFAEDWDRYNKMFAAGKLSVEQLTKAQADLLAKQPAIKEAADAHAKALQENAAAHERMREALNADVAVSEKGAATLTDQNKTLRDEIELIGLSEAAQHAITQARGEAVILIKEQELATITAADNELETMSRRQIALAAEIEQLRERNKLTGAKFNKTRVAKAADDANKEWRKFTDDIEKGLTDSLFRGFEAGKGFFKSFWDGIKNLFKTTVLKLAVQGVMTGVTGTASGAASAASGGGGIGGMLGNVGGLFGGGSAGGILDLLGSTGMGALDFGGVSLSGLSGIASSIGSIASIAGPIALGVSAIMAIHNATKGESRTGGQYGVSFDGTLTNNRRGETYTQIGQQYNRNNGTGQAFASGSAYLIEADGMGSQDDAVRAAVAATAAGINATLAAVGSTATLTGFSAGLETSGKGRGGVFAGGMLSTGQSFGESGKGDNYAGTLYETTSSTSPDAAAAMANFSSDLLQVTIQALQAAADVPESIKRIVKDVDAEGLTDDAAKALLAQVDAQVTGINAFRAALGSLPFDNLRGLSFDAAGALVDLMGGVENLGTALSGYYQNFYSEGERAGIALKNVQDAMAAMGQGSVDTRAEFRALLEAQDPTTEAGRMMTAQLLSLQSAFADAYPEVAAVSTAVEDVEEVAATLAQTLDALRNPVRNIEDIAKNIIDLEESLFQAENAGNVAALRERELKGLTETEAALVRRLHALEDEAAAIAKATAIASERKDLERQLLEMQGDTAALRALDRAALDESNRALYDRINAIKDEAEAAAKAATIANERTGLENQLLTLLGETDELRARERAALDDSNRAIYDQIKAEEDRQAVIAKATAIANERAGIERDILALNGDTAAIRALELAGLDAANRALKEHYYALLDEAAAATAAAAAATAAANEHQGLQERLWQIQGNTDALRKAALDKLLTDENRAMQNEIWAAEKVKELQASATAAAEKAAQEQQAAAEKIRSAWSGISDSLVDEIKRIRGEMMGTGEVGYAQSQAQFAIALAQAQAGDQDAMASLPGLSKTMLGLADDNATSMAELRLIQAQTAAQLEAANATALGRARDAAYAVPGAAYSADTGAVVVPQAYSSNVQADTASSRETADLRREVAALREDLKAALGAIATNTGKTHRQLEKWDVTGAPVTNVGGQVMEVHNV